MIPFLKETAQQLLDSGRDLKDLRVVLPNRRAGLFFTKYLGELIQQPVWMPEVVTIEQLVYQLAGNTPSDDLTLVFELYEEYRSLQKEAEPFDRFYHWGELILKDFNDLDQFLAPVKQVYAQLAEIKEFESDLSFLTEEQLALIAQFWKAFERQNETEKERFLKFWQILGALYEGFQVRLQTSGKAYGGQLYRQVASTREGIAKPDKHLIFIGFNAFTLAEEKIITHFITAFGAEIFWDVDAYYLDDRLQEAGLFFRDYRKDSVLGNTFPGRIPAEIKRKGSQIHTHAIPLKTNQANLVGKLLEQVGANEPLEETVIILPDEQLLFPVLHQLPEVILKLNVTMGYPMRNAPIYAFLDTVLDLQRHSKLKEGKVTFYHKPVLELLAYSYLQAADGAWSTEAASKIQTENWVDVPEELVSKENTLFGLVFQKVAGESLIDYLIAIIEHLAKELQEDPTQKSYLFQAFKQLNRVKGIFAVSGGKGLKVEFLLSLFRKLFRDLKLPFEGEPLQGLQVMGVLESRNLDFRRVIICDVNEGSFPPGGGIQSMIPMNLRKAFRLPVQEQNDAIYAYTFYRLLHRAEEVHLIYTTAGDQGKASEMSRFIQQMRVELPIAKPESVLVPVNLNPNQPIILAKTSAMLASLARYFKPRGGGEAEKKFSASALNMYLDCRLRFYLRYVAELKEKEQVVTTIDPMTFGTLLHKGIELLYAIPEGMEFRDLDGHEINRLLPQVPKAVDQALRELYKKEEGEELLLTGQLQIARQVLTKYMEAVLAYDQRNGPFRIIGLEKEHLAHLSIETEEGTKEVALGGVIDRIDLRDSSVRLLDYKTGKDTKKISSIASLFDREDKKRNKAALQTFLYAFFYKYQHPENQLPLKPGIINIKEIYSQDFNPYLQLDKSEVNDYREFAEEYEQRLRGLLEEIINPKVPFDQTEDKKKCEFCAYKELCGR
ncbi:MAG: PD-(D/E)XK nuclease family protein [Algoriphagus sp.]|nr:PD-(D/E)XK nuclease family protein [Algoriphagus sp.]